MPSLNWGLINDGGTFESLMHAILYAETPSTILFGRSGKDAGQDARTADGSVVFQAKYRQNLNMDGAVTLALEELTNIKKYRQPAHSNRKHWERTRCWVMVANFSINPNDVEKWQKQIVPAFEEAGLAAEYWDIEVLEGKLAQHSEVADVFFRGQNRVLVGLKEAHDLLVPECGDSESFDLPIVGREEELALIRDFAVSADKRFLPLIGPCGIGKTRLLYEGLVSLAQEGWRVLWGLPGTMAGSSQWFRLLNGNQKTCVALDDPDDPRLLKAVLEQLATAERRNWCVISTCRTEKAEALRQFRNNRNVHQAIELNPLDESASYTLMKAYLGGRAQPSWLHSVYRFTHGVPGWLCLISEMAKRDALSELPVNADEVVASYVKSCLSTLDGSCPEKALVLLRWLALWGTIRGESANEERAQFRFLETQGVPERTARNIIERLVATGLVHNWGVGKRLFGIKPLIVHQQILSDWLFCENNGTYKLSHEGESVLSQLLSGQVPAEDSALESLSHLARSRLTEPEAGSLMRPLFSSLERMAQEGCVKDQHNMADLIKMVGGAAPESALDVLAAIRQNPKENMEVDVPHWGQEAFTHEALLAKLPKILSEVAENVADPIVATRYIEEFRRFIALEETDSLHEETGEGVGQLLRRVLCESGNSEVFARPAHDIVVAELANPKAYSFLGLLLECALNPVRESMDWTANWTTTITTRPFLPGGTQWNLAADLRSKTFLALQNDMEPKRRALLWGILGESHHEFHRAITKFKMRGSTRSQYHDVLISDLKTCGAILSSPPLPLSLDEATQARGMWSWYLRYGQDEDLVDLARRCEQVYNGLSKWRLHDFFCFKSSEEMCSETERIANLLKTASGPELFKEFFDEVKTYLDAVRQGHQDGADSWAISNLAAACADLFSLDTSTPVNALTAFILEVLGQQEPTNPMAWNFVIRVCQQHLFAVKTTEGYDVVDWLTRLLDLTARKSSLLWGLYSNAHPKTTGTLTNTELNFVLTHEENFSGDQWSFLLGAFSTVHPVEVQTRLRNRLDSLRNDPVKASQCLASVIRSISLAALRFKWLPTQLPVEWIIRMIIEFQLDGTLLGMHDLKSLRDQANFRLSMFQMLELIRSRIELNQPPRINGRLKIVPHDFAIGAWCSFDGKDEAESKAFHELCSMALKPNSTIRHRIPKYLVQLDPSGHHVASFVEQQISDGPEIAWNTLARLGDLASAYGDDSEAWAVIASPICERTQMMRREEREQVYFGLSRKDTGMLESKPGQVASYYVQRLETTKRMLAAEAPQSPLRAYREWVKSCAENDLRYEEGSAEEDACP